MRPLYPTWPARREARFCLRQNSAVGELKLPEGIFAQTVSGDYAVNKENVEDRDMLLKPDPATIAAGPVGLRPIGLNFSGL